ncbi:MAG TPA: cupredoxin domain-containing protein [Tepidiformaceae bacterium]|nr:cupredoxin domain-containing protein [Tepidiformaceae bacterium]
MKTRLGWVILPLAGMALFAGACGGGGGDDEEGQVQTLGNRTFSDHGTTDVTGKADAEIEADSFYFEPTFLRGEPGQKMTIKVGNDSNALHNFSISSMKIDTDIPAEGSAQIEVTFPQTGALVFFCKYHSAQGMNGELLAGDAQPQAANS